MARFLSSALTSLALCMLANTSMAASLVSGEVDVKRRAERVKAAQHLLDQVDKLAGLIQAPRPSEESWVRAEQAEIRKLANPEASTARSIQLLQTPEFQQQNVHSSIQDLRSALRCVIDSPPTTQREILCWATAAYVLDYRDVFYDGLQVLVRAKRLPEDIGVRAGAASLEGISLLYRIHAQSIQQYLVLPYLRGDIK